MKWKIETKKKSIRIGMLLLWFVFVGALSFTLGKYVQLRTVSSAKVTVNANDYERVYDEKAPYEKTDGLGKYYIHYTGEKTKRKKVDLKDDIVENKILDTQITSTYKLFANNANIEQVLLTESLREKMSNEMFDGTTQLLDCIYRYDAMKNNKTYTGAEDYARIAAPNIDVYYCLENFTYQKTNSGSPSYETKIQKIYVHKSVHEVNSPTSLDYLFAYNYDNVKRVLLDDEGHWQTFDSFAYIAHIDQLSEHFKIPKTAVNLKSMFAHTDISNIDHLDLSNYPNVTNASDMFANTKITSIPDGMSFFQGNNNMVIRNMFSDSSIQTIGSNVSFTGKDMNRLFGFSNLDSVGENFQLLGNVEDISYMFEECGNIKFQDGFSIPSTVKDASYLFWESNLETVPSNLFENATSLTDISWMFHFTGITELPENLRIPSTVIDASYLFDSCINLKFIPTHFFDNVSDNINLSSAFSGTSNLGGVLALPRNCTKIASIFQNAGTTNNTNVSGFDTPIVMIYDPENSVQNTFAYTYNDGTNVKGNTYPDGKVSAIPYLDSIFEKKTGSGPYTDSNNQKYYLRYKKNDTKVNLDYYSTSGKMYWIEDKEFVPMTSTYHMFENNPNIERVILPDCMKNGVDSDTFMGASKSNIMLLYRDTNNKENSVPTIQLNNNASV